MDQVIAEADAKDANAAKAAKDGGKFKSVSCAPKDETINETKDFSCYSSKSLDKLKILWNKRHPDQKIQDTDPRAIWTALKNNMSRVCHLSLPIALVKK